MCFGEDRLRKAMPTGDRSACEMVGAPRYRFSSLVPVRHCQQGARDRARMCGRSNLIRHDSEFFVFPAKPEHRAYKVVAMRAEDPRDPHDQMFVWQPFPDRLFTLPLAPSIYA